MTQLTVGDTVPDFDLPRDGGGRISLSEFSGKPVVIFFYPKDDTSGCTSESVAFTALKPQFDAEGVIVMGMSPDSAKSHDKFVKKHALGIPLAADEEKAVLETFGVWKEKSMYGKKYMGVERTTFLIDKSGKVAKIWEKVKVAGHADEVLKAAKEL